MRKIVSIFVIPFVFLFVFAQTNFCNYTKVYASGVDDITISNYNYEFYISGKKYFYKTNDFKEYIKFSAYQKLLFKQYSNRHQIINILLDYGFNLEDSIFYAFPEISIILNKLKIIENKNEIPESVSVIKNECKIKINPASSGKFIDLPDFFKQFYQQSAKGKNIKLNVNILTYKKAPSIKNEFLEKSCFSTGFSTSSESRKNNIKTALKSFDGLILEDGEVFSFNNITGERTKERGYMAAKIISGGTFIEGYGGGVCQVSTTLYNACLLAGLEIIEANSHSLPVSYVEPSFDAMVNSGSSDLIVRNNTGGKIIFTTSSKNDICKVKIFGKKNKYKITRISEKVKIIPAEEDIIDTDYLKYGTYDLEVGEEKRISYSKNGYISNGYLNFYDAEGNLVETKHIRKNKYNPQKGVVIKREN